MQKRFVLNGYALQTASPSLSYGELVELAGYPADAIISIVVSEPGREGKTLMPGQTLALVDGVIINACDTSNA